MLNIKRISVGMIEENAYLIWRDGSNEAYIIDPGDGLNDMLSALDEIGVKLTAILLTHGHFDHILSAEALIEKTGAALYAHAEECALLNDESFNMYSPSICSQPSPRTLAAIPYPSEIFGLTVLNTPGHTIGSVCLYSKADACVFSGDTIFNAGYGRTDLPTGDFMQLRRSIASLLELPPETRVYPGHGIATTIARERERYGL